MSEQANNWAHLTLAWDARGLWLKGDFGFRDVEAVDSFIVILKAIRAQLHDADDSVALAKEAGK